ncbi:hypothetical protein C8Q78DRAFT_247779 [Trametes maxima]|nr:hypothetical protein C8Q78DRAFT_247779 [Trametes maxima]
MENCILPIELCEVIMDTIPSSPHFLTPREHDALVACSLVCTTWRTRAAVILEKRVNLESPQIVSQFAFTLRRESSGCRRADYISYLLLDWSRFKGDKNLSRAMELFMTPLPGLKILDMDDVHIDVSPRILRCMRPPLFTGITCLYFSDCKFCSWRAMLDIVWGCLKLEDLSLSHCSFGGNPATPDSIARLSVGQRSLRGCQYLKELDIWMDADMGRLLPGNVIFGDTLTKLKIGIPHYDTMDQEITPLFRDSFPHLESIHLWISRDSDRVVYRGPCLLLAFATGPSPRPALHSVFIYLRFDVFPEEHGGVSHGVPQLLELIIGRAGEWDGHPLRSLLTGLRRVKVKLHGSNDRADGEACARHVLSVLPDVHDILQVYIDPRIVVYPPETTSSSPHTMNLE